MQQGSGPGSFLWVQLPQEVMQVGPLLRLSDLTPGRGLWLWLWYRSNKDEAIL